MNPLNKMNALGYILEHYQDKAYQDDFRIFGEREFLRALVHTLQKEELQALKRELKRGSSKWSVGNELYREASEILTTMQSQRNEAISTLLGYFTDKKGGKVTEARQKLRDRFRKQSFQTQRKILKTMLYASKQDRLWAYNQLRNNWYSSLFEDIKVLWEQYHEEECGWVVIRHFPMDYVYNHLAELDTDKNYTNICIRLIHYPLFHIDKERLGHLEDKTIYSEYPEVNYLYILAKSKSKVEKGEVIQILFNQIVSFVNNEETPFFKYDEHARRFSHRVRDGILSVASAYPIHLILWCMGELGLAEEIIAFEEWDNLVKKKFLEREELDNIGHDCTPDDDKELWNLFRQTITECLPDEYKKLIQVDFYSLSKTEPIKDELIRKNPAIDTLVERLKLEKT